MSFGKRNCSGTNKSVHQRDEQNGAIKNRPDPDSAEGKAIAAREKKYILAGKVTCVLFLLGYGYFIIYGASALNQTPIANVLGGVNSRSILPSQKSNRTAAQDQIVNTCLPKLTEKETKNNEADFWKRIEILAHEQQSGSQPASQTDTTHTLGLAAYLKCSMSTNRERLCKSQARADMAFEIRYYFMTVQRDYENAMAAAKSAAEKEDFMAKINRMQNKREDAVFLRRSKNLAREPGEPDPNVVRGMRDLIAHGYLSKTDFGSVFSPKLASSITGVVYDLDACASTL